RALAARPSGPRLASWPPSLLLAVLHTRIFLQVNLPAAFQELRGFLVHSRLDGSQDVRVGVCCILGLADARQLQVCGHLVAELVANVLADAHGAELRATHR